MKYRLLVLALGNFAIGTETFMIAGVLPELAGDLRVSLSTAGQLVTAFSLAYAIGSPVMAMFTGQMERRKLLVGSLMLFALANFVCGLSNHYAMLFLGRVLAAIGAGLFVPGASTTAAFLVAPEKRGRALAIVIGGQTVALCLGVPLGTWIAYAFDWRTTFWMVGTLSLIAAVLIHFWLPTIASTVPVTLRERLYHIKRPVIWTSLLSTVCWATGAFTVYTYIADVFGQLGASPQIISVVLLIWGISSLIGNTLGGVASDRFGSYRTIPVALAVFLVVLTSFSVLTSGQPSRLALWIGCAAMVVWGVSAWSFTPSQQHRLIGLSGKASGIVVPLNPSAIYLGSALGAAIGGIFVKYGNVEGLGYFGGFCELLALSWFAASRMQERKTQVSEEAT